MLKISPWHASFRQNRQLTMGIGNQVIRFDDPEIAEGIHLVETVGDGIDREALLALADSNKKEGTDDAIRQLLSIGVLIEEDVASSDQLITFRRVRDYPAQVGTKRVAVLGSSDVAADIRTGAGHLGLELTDSPETDPLTILDSFHRTARPDVIVWAPGGTEFSSTRDVIKRCQARHLPLLPVIPFDGAMALVGPFSTGPATPCLECAMRWRSLGQPQAQLIFDLMNASRELHAAPGIDKVLAGVAEAALWAAASGPRPGFGAAVSVAWSDQLEVRSHSIPTMPDCEACYPRSHVLDGWNSSKFIEGVTY